MYVKTNGHRWDCKSYDHENYYDKQKQYQIECVDDKSCLDKLLYEQERLLWLHVIIQAVYDARNIATDRASRRHKTRAVMWLSLTNKDFIFVCEMAGVDAVYILRIVKKYLQQSIKQRRKKKRLAQIIHKKGSKFSPEILSLLCNMLETPLKSVN